ncbi:MAG: hypothetical protein HUU48_06540 [Flavobacteriales bacterium]|nr:hypothetical protein [Flavobacteriales bacterium]
MFRFFSSNQPYVLFFVPLLAVALLLPIGFGPTPTVFYQQTVFISELFIAISNSNWVIYLISFFILSVNSVLIHQLTDKQSIFVKSNHITSVIYILLIAISPKISGLLQLHISSFFVLLVLIRISNLYMVEKPYSILFDCGLLLSLSSLFYLPSGFLLIWIYITTLIFKPITWRDFFIPIAGFITPYLFYTFFLFYFDKSIDSSIQLVSFFNALIVLSASDMISFGFIFALIAAALLTYFMNLQRKSVRVRNLYLSYLWLFIIIFLSILSFNGNIRTTTGLFAIPFSILLTDFLFVLEKRKWLPELIMVLLLVFFLFNHISINNWFSF